MHENKVLAAYDVRGIQSYIFKTPKIKDAIGASDMIENMIENALQYAAEKLVTQGVLEKNAYQLTWCDSNHYFPYEENSGQIQVLFIGGGNAYVLFANAELCKKVTCLMSKYVLDKTYSLQLAVAKVEVTGNYAADYQNLHKNLITVKANSKPSRPVAAMPFMQVETNTGYPLTDKQVSSVYVSSETYEKRKQEEIVTKHISKQDKILDNYKQEKSMLAVVHLDGNNMGLRIRALVEGKTDYTEAINQMRKLSFHINTSYKKVFEEMQNKFNVDSNLVIRKMIVAGDDITYVCAAEAALASVEYFCKHITKYTMLGSCEALPTEAEKQAAVTKYGFSVCAGIAYMKSHFPFWVAYETAEECCGSAKERAKQPVHMDGERVGNFVDFQVCKNIHASDIEAVREKEYRTALGENLCLRPYFIETDMDYGFAENRKKLYTFSNLKTWIAYFSDETKIPRNFAKQLRNTYSEGENKVQLLQNFLESRNHKMPQLPKETGGRNQNDLNAECKATCVYQECSKNLTELESRITNVSFILENEEKVALWYDALELMDLYETLEWVDLAENDGGTYEG